MFYPSDDVTMVDPDPDLQLIPVRIVREGEGEGSQILRGSSSSSTSLNSLARSTTSLNSLARSSTSLNTMVNLGGGSVNQSGSISINSLSGSGGERQSPVVRYITIERSSQLRGESNDWDSHQMEDSGEDISSSPVSHRGLFGGSTRVIFEDLREEEDDEVDGYSEQEEEEEEEEKDSGDEDNEEIEEAIFERELRDFSENLKLNITKDSNKTHLDFLASYFGFVKLATIIGAEEGQPYSKKIHQVEHKLKEYTREKKDSSWSLSLREKKCAAELILEALSALKKRDFSETMAVAEEMKKRAEKEYQNSGENIKDKVICMRFLIFAHALLISHVKEKKLLLPLDLLPEEQRKSILSIIKTKLLTLQNSIFRRKSDTLRRRGTKPAKEQELVELEFDSLLRSVYPIVSECGGYTSPSLFLQRYAINKLRVDTSYLPEREESSVAVCVGKYLVRTAWAKDSLATFSSSGESEKVVEFKPVYCFIYKKQGNISIRTKATVFEVPGNYCKGNILNLKISFFDENYDIYKLSIADSDEDEEVSGEVSVPSCVKRNLMVESHAGHMKTEPYQEISKLGLFLLSEVHDFHLDSLDEEKRSLLHYAAWIGTPDIVEVILRLMPALAFCKDEYGETPLMLAVKGGRSCIQALRLLLVNCPLTLLNSRNEYGQTALHIAAQGVDLTVAEILIKAGANFTLRDNDGKLPIEVIEAGSTVRKAMVSLFKKFSR